jgi:HEAT repeat protein
MSGGHDALIESLGTSKWQDAYRALCDDGPDALPAILRGLKHPNWRVRKRCASFLDHFADASCVPAAVEALRDPSADVRRHALHALGCQACKTSPLKVDVVARLLPLALSDPSIRVRRAAVHMLGNQPGDDRVRRSLTNALKTESDAKWLSSARWALGQHAAT